MSELPARPPLSAEAEAVLRVMERHRSVRAYAPAPLEDAVIERAVAAAQCAATSSWIQAYHLVQVTDPATRAEVAALAGGQAQIEEAGAFFVVCGDARRHRLIAEREGAPHVPCAEAFLLATVDATLFAQNLCLAFESMGLGTCYIGGIRNDLPALDRALELPLGLYPLFGLCAGEPAADPGTRPRLPPAAVWSKDRYPEDSDVMRHIADHDRVAAAYYEQRGAPGRDWSGGTWRKFRRDPRPDVGPYYESKGARFGPGEIAEDS